MSKWKPPKQNGPRKPRLALPVQTGGAHRAAKGGPYKRSSAKQDLRRQSHD